MSPRFGARRASRRSPRGTRRRRRSGPSGRGRRGCARRRGSAAGPRRDVQVVAGADARTARRPPDGDARARARSAAVVIFTLASSPATSRTAMPGLLGEHRLVGAATRRRARASIAAASTSRRNACGVCARNSVSRGSVADDADALAGATCFTVSCTGTAGNRGAARRWRASMVRSITSALDERPRRVVDEDDVGASARPRRSRSATESCRRAPPVTTRRGVAGGRHSATSVALRRHDDDDLVHARVRVEGGDAALEQRPAADRQPLLGHAGAEARAAAAGGDDDRHAS